MKLDVIFMLFGFVCFSQTSKKHTVFFETDQYNIIETEKNRLYVFVSNLEIPKIKEVFIYGYCDDRGSEKYNLILSQNRASAIKKEFIYKTKDSSFVKKVNGMGEVLINKVSKDSLSTIRSLNRRVDVEVVYKSNKIKKKGLLERKLKIGDTIKLPNILFETGYSYVVPESKQYLDQIVEELNLKPKIHFLIQGHVCCTKGSRDAVDRLTGKRNLSIARAKYIYNYLKEKGIKEYRMRYTGLRRRFPLGGESKFDRRVEFIITKN